MKSKIFWYGTHLLVFFALKMFLLTRTFNHSHSDESDLMEKVTFPWYGREIYFFGSCFTTFIRALCGGRILTSVSGQKYLALFLKVNKTTFRGGNPCRFPGKRNSRMGRILCSDIVMRHATTLCDQCYHNTWIVSLRTALVNVNTVACGKVNARLSPSWIHQVVAVVYFFFRILPHFYVALMFLINS